MTATTTIDLAERLIATPARPRSRAAPGIRRLSLFGSVARGDVEANSDIDLAAEFDPATEMENPRLRANVECDRRVPFETRPGGQPAPYH